MVEKVKKNMGLLFVTMFHLFAMCEARLTCPKYEDIATDFAAHLDVTKYAGYWYEVYSHNVFLVDTCHCTRYNFTMTTETEFTDVFSCEKSGKPFDIHNKGSIDPDTPGKMVESLGPTSPPYWVLGLWNADGVLLDQKDDSNYAFALVYACVGSPLLGEYTYFFSRNDTIPDSVYTDMRSYAKDHDI